MDLVDAGHLGLDAVRFRVLAASNLYALQIRQLWGGKESGLTKLKGPNRLIAMRQVSLGLDEVRFLVLAASNLPHLYYSQA